MQGGAFVALVKKIAADDVLAELSAFGVFSHGIHDDCTLNPYPQEWGTLRSVYDFLLSNDRFAKELEAGLARSGRPNDVVFLPNATPRQILGLALLLVKNPLYRSLQYVLMLRYSVHIPVGPLSNRQMVVDKENVDRYAMAMEKLQRVDTGGVVRFATDSEELAKEYAAYTAKPIEVLPIPHTSQPVQLVMPADFPVRSPGKIRLVFLGDAREEKGFEFLPAVVGACAGNASRVPVEFVFQAYISSHHHAPMARVIEALAQANLPDVHLIKRSLSSDEYHLLLTSADLVLLPYDVATYRARTSGPFVEAICADKPVVIPGESWMSRQLGASGAGVVFHSGNAADLARAVQAALANLAQHQIAAAELGRQFRAYHNPRTFLERLMPDNVLRVAAVEEPLPSEVLECAG
jgi:glycosyltransferase involved in cell wall biosynthesis